MKKSKDYFAEVAKKWDRLRVGYFTETMRDAAIACINLNPSDIVADVGSGTGFMIQALAPRVSKVYGFDESPQMLEVARLNLEAFTNVELQVSQGEKLPAVDGLFNAVFGNMYLHHTMEPLAAIKELYRVLRPDGWLMLIDMDAHDQVWMREAMADHWLGFDRDNIRSWYTAAGFTNVTVTCAKGSCCTVSPDGKDLAIGIFVAYGQK